jgi:inhibitor of cysteine peptidase
VLAGCSGASADKVYGKEDTNITVSEGDAFTIQLEENPTTGYGWAVSISDDSVIKLTDDQYTTDRKNKNVEGAGGVHGYEFEALAKGTAQITFVYERSFEENSAIETVVYNITVTQN